MDRSDRRPIGDPGQIRALSSAVRQELVDTLAALGGEASVGMLAEQLGRPADGLYYHMRLLARHGLVEESAAEGGEQRYRLSGTGNGPLRLAYRTGPEGNLMALGGFARSMLQVAQGDFEQALKMGDAAMEGSHRELWAARNKGWVGPEDIEEINALLQRLDTLLNQPRAPDRSRLMSFAFVLAPLQPRPKRRNSAARPASREPAS